LASPQSCNDDPSEDYHGTRNYLMACVRKLNRYALYVCSFYIYMYIKHLIILESRSTITLKRIALIFHDVSFRRLNKTKVIIYVRILIFKVLIN